jgi:hypothetical protein
MRENKLRQLLDADLPSLGTHVMSTWPSVIELVGNSGAKLESVTFLFRSTTI